jgi:hypothetical protein
MITKKIKHKGGFLGFGTKRHNNNRSRFSSERKSHKNPRIKMKDVIARTYKQILVTRVNNQLKKNDEIVKYCKYIIQLSPELKEIATKLQTESDKNTKIYKKYLAKNKWDKIISGDEQRKIIDIAIEQKKNKNYIYDDNRVEYLVQNIISQISKAK